MSIGLSGRKEFVDGIQQGVSYFTRVWANRGSKDTMTRLSFDTSGGIYPQNMDYKGYGQVVRCERNEH